MPCDIIDDVYCVVMYRLEPHVNNTKRKTIFILLSRGPFSTIVFTGNVCPYEEHKKAKINKNPIIYLRISVFFLYQTVVDLELILFVGG